MPLRIFLHNQKIAANIFPKTTNVTDMYSPTRVSVCQERLRQAEVKCVRWGRPYPAACGRPPSALGWCLRCGAPRWKAPPHLPPPTGSAPGRTPSTLKAADGVGQRETKVIICGTICKNPPYIRPWRTDAGFCSHSACFFFFFPSPSIEVVVLQCAYSYSKITWQHSLMQPEVLFKDTPPEVFLTAWCVALNYTYKSLRANQLGVFHFDSSSHGEVSETVPPFFPPSLLSASERSWWLRERLEPVKASFIKAEKPLSWQKQRWSCFPLTQRDQ